MTYHARMYAGVCPECFYTYVSDKKKDWAPHCTECGTLRFRRSAKSLDQLVTQVWESVRQVGDEEVMRRRVDEAVHKYNEMVGTGLLARNRYTGSLGDTEEIRMGWRSRALRGRRKKKFQWRPYVPYRMELIGRLEGPIVGSVCGSCGWVLIMAGRPRRRACPVCDVEHMRTHGGDGFDEMSRSLISSEVAHPDPIGGEVYIKGRVANALERFNERKDDWFLAEEIAVEEGAPAHPAGSG